MRKRCNNLLESAKSRSSSGATNAPHTKENSLLKSMLQKGATRGGGNGGTNGNGGAAAQNGFK